MQMFEGVLAASSKESRAAELAKLPLLERLAQRIVDGERNGLLEPDRIGVTLSEELQLHPEQSTDAFVLHHPEAKYFNV